MGRRTQPVVRRVDAQFPALQAGVLAAAEASGARLVSMENVYMYGRPAGHPLTEERAHDAHTTKGRRRERRPKSSSQPTGPDASSGCRALPGQSPASCCQSKGWSSCRSVEAERSDAARSSARDCRAPKSADRGTQHGPNRTGKTARRTPT